MNLIKFTSDTKYRKQWFTGISFSHPAKMSLPLQLWLIENFTKEGEIILDPMAGSGTILVACSMGRNVITVELEDKFVQMQRGNWAKIQQRGCQMGYSMGNATILQGDARDLAGVLADKIITSPPFQAQKTGGKQGAGSYSGTDLSQGINRVKDNYAQADNPANISNLPYGNVDKIITSPPYAEAVQGSRHSDHQPEQRRKRLIKAGYNPDDYQLGKGRQCEVVWEYGKGKDNLGNLPYGLIDAVISSPPYSEQPQLNRTEHGILSHPPDCNCNFCLKNKGNKGMGQGYRRQVDHIITSPPYEEALGKKHHSPRADKLAGEKHNPVTYTGKVDAVISSPPYEGSVSAERSGIDWAKGTRGVAENNKPRDRSKEPAFNHTPGFGLPFTYTNNQDNIGNLKSISYLSAMLQVYKQCHAVLKDGGLMVLVTKNFIRNKKQVRLDLDTIRLCEQAGFIFRERWYRELASQSFWRIIYHQKYPDVEPIKHEDILIFSKRIHEKDSTKL